MMNQLAIRISSPTDEREIPAIVWEDFDGFKAALADHLKKYEGMVYTADSVQDAKRDRAYLNKLAAAIDTERKRYKAYYLHPYEQFEAQAKEVTAMVKQLSAAIDTQIKAYDDARKQDKKADILKYFEDNVGDLAELVPFESIFRDAWLNVSYRMTAIQTEITRNFEIIRSGIATIRDTCGQDVDACLDVYLNGRYDLSAAIAKHKQLEEIREAQAKREANMAEKLESLKRDLLARDGKQQEPPDSPPAQAPAAAQAPIPAPDERRYSIDFRVTGTLDQINALKAFLKANCYQYGPVPKG